MPKVINALEHLEGLATKNERENTTVQELKSRIAQLENDKVEKAEDRQRFEKVNMVGYYVFDAYVPSDRTYRTM
jgi:DNA repair exonuclease SbcCD ATPase subunit